MIYKVTTDVKIGTECKQLIQPTSDSDPMSGMEWKNGIKIDIELPCQLFLLHYKFKEAGSA
jgi:hypothetical protein